MRRQGDRRAARGEPRHGQDPLRAHLDKYGVSDRAAAVAKALRDGLIE